ncbi:HNH endonuclease [Streptomyces paradoxus]|uniref:HNH endonuclease n=1 Tax=Streptomyces paradoxus TaxID=66375 RepID=UPI0036F6BDCC
MVWEWLAVLTANEGKCVYCGEQAQTMGHVIPFADGGLDDLPNLVPACHSCNLRKRDKALPVWWMSMDLKYRWSGEGTPQAGAMYMDGSLRDLYLSTHEEVLAVLAELDLVCREITHERRTAWFRDRYAWWGYPGRSFDPAGRASNQMARIKKAGAEGRPPLSVEINEILAKHGISL